MWTYIIDLIVVAFLFKPRLNIKAVDNIHGPFFFV